MENTAFQGLENLKTLWNYLCLFFFYLKLEAILVFYHPSIQIRFSILLPQDRQHSVRSWNGKRSIVQTSLSSSGQQDNLGRGSVSASYRENPARVLRPFVRRYIWLWIEWSFQFCFTGAIGLSSNSGFSFQTDRQLACGNAPDSFRHKPSDRSTRLQARWRQERKSFHQQLPQVHSQLPQARRVRIWFFWRF